MEDRSSRCVRILVALLARSRPGRYEIACALISMVARSMTRSNVRPDTLMQDPHPTDRRKPLATRGRTIRRARAEALDVHCSSKVTARRQLRPISAEVAKL